MSEVMPEDMHPARAGPVRSPQGLVAGLTLVALAALALWLTRDLEQGTLNAMGPAMLPRWLAIAVGLCGLALVGTSLTTGRQGLERWSLRGVTQGSCRSFGNVRYSFSPPTAKASVLQWRGYDLPTLKLAAMNSMAATRR